MLCIEETYLANDSRRCSLPKRATAEPLRPRWASGLSIEGVGTVGWTENFAAHVKPKP